MKSDDKQEMMMYKIVQYGNLWGIETADGEIISLPNQTYWYETEEQAKQALEEFMQA